MCRDKTQSSSMPGLMMIILCLLQVCAIAAAADHKGRVSRCIQRYTGFNGSTGSNNTYQTQFDGVTWDEDDWILSTTKLEQGRFQSRGSVANGYFGINVASVGPFFELDSPDEGDIINGWPLFSRRQSFATIAGFWDSQAQTNESNFPWLSQYGYDTAISGVPHWSGLILDLGGDDYLDATVNNDTISDFTSAYDFKAGVLSWLYKWTPSGHKKGSYQVQYHLFVNKFHVNQAVVDIEIIPSIDINGSIVNVLDGYSAVRTDFVESGEEAGAIFSAVKPIGISNVTGYIYTNLTASGGVNLTEQKIVHNKPYLHKNDSSIAQAVPVQFRAGRTVRVTKYVGAASSDAFDDPKKTARNAVAAAKSIGHEATLKAHLEEWASVMPDDSVDHYAFPDNGTLPADQHIIDSAIIAVANTYYLVQNTVGKNAIKEVHNASVNVDSIVVGGLSSDSYAGQVFWDADLWMQPGLTASHPEAAQRITNYRLERYGQAKENVKTSYTGSQNKTVFSPSAAAYPWTSGRFGNCTATGPCWDYEYHLNGDIGLSFINQWVTSGDTKFFKENLFPIYDSIATLYADLLKKNGSSWTLTNMTDPDEYANHIDAGGFTMPLIGETLMYANDFRKQFGLEENKTWAEKAENVLVIRDNDVTLEFTTMNGSAVVKQADVILVTYPLTYTNNYTSQDALNDLDYYANKQSPDGPAMTWAFFSIIANEMSPSGCSAFTYAQYSYQPYARAPFYQLSEQLDDNATTNGGTHPAYPFLTGHGGANQVGLFGYLGLRLLPDDILHVEPNLPPQIPYIKYRTFYWRGWPISAWSNYTHTSIKRATKTKPLDIADKRFENTSIIVHSGPEDRATRYTLSVNSTLVIHNRQIGTKNTFPGNLVQCQPVESQGQIVLGQFPIAAVDGATSTKWQPLFATNVSYLTVTVAEEEFGAPVHGFAFNWAQAPPVNATVVFHNEKLKNPAQVSTSEDHTGSYQVITSLTDIKASDPYLKAMSNLDTIAIPIGNTTNVTLSKPTYMSRYATLLITGNQALDEIEIRKGNGTGATVAEWVIIGQEKGSSERAILDTPVKRNLRLRTVTGESDPGRFMRRRYQD